MVRGSDFATTGTIVGGAFVGLSALRRRRLEPETKTGLLDLERALFSMPGSEASTFSLSSSEIGGGEVTWCLREERVVGPK